MAKKIKILHVVSTMGRGGIETFLVSMLSNYDRQVFQMDVCCVGGEEGDYAEEVRRTGSELYCIKMGYDMVRFLPKFTRFLKKQKYDVVNAHVGDFCGPILMASQWAGVYGRVASYHNVQGHYRKDGIRKPYVWLMRWLTEKYSNGITGCSKAVLDAYYPGWKARTDKCFRVCYYGIDCNKFAVSDDRVVVRKELGIDENAIVVGHVGRFCKSKNHKVIIDVAKIITQKDPNINFVLVGDGELKTEIEEYSESQGLAGKVIFTGKRSDIPRLLSSFDVFFFPSIDEGFSVVIMEVQAAGLAIVASSIAGLREAVAPEYLDFLVAPEDTISFSRLLLELIRNPEKRKILADRGKQFVLNFTMQASVERFQRVYMALLSED